MRYFLWIGVVFMAFAPNGWGEGCTVAGDPTAGASFQDHATYETTTLHVRVPAGDKVQMCDITPAVSVLVSGTVTADATTGAAPVALTAPLIAGHVLQLQVQAANANTWQNAGTIPVENVCDVPAGPPALLLPVPAIGIGATTLNFNVNPGFAVRICGLGQNTVLPSTAPATADAEGRAAITLTAPLADAQVIQVQVQAPGSAMWQNVSDRMECRCHLQTPRLKPPRYAAGASPLREA